MDCSWAVRAVLHGKLHHLDAATQVQVLRLTGPSIEIVGVHWSQHNVRFRPVLDATEGIGGYLQTVVAVMGLQKPGRVVPILSAEELRFRCYSVMRDNTSS